MPAATTRMARTTARNSVAQSSGATSYRIVLGRAPPEQQEAPTLHSCLSALAAFERAGRSAAVASLASPACFAMKWCSWPPGVSPLLECVQ